MNRHESMAVVGLVLVGLLGLTGCAGQTSSAGQPSASAGTGKHRVSGKVMCEAHGGTYNATTQQCAYTAQTRPMHQSCTAQGGTWDTAAGACMSGN